MKFTILDKQVKVIRFEEKTYLIVQTVEQALDSNDHKAPKKLIKCIKIFDDKQSYRDYIILDEFEIGDKTKVMP